MEKVSVSKGLLVGLVVVAAMSLLALAFVLGRASGSLSPSGPPSGHEMTRAAVPSPVSEPRAPDQPAEPFLPTHPAAPSVTESIETRPAPGPDSAPAADEPDRAGPASERGAVRAYLDAVDRIQPGKMSGDAEGTANEMAAALAKGDTSDLDRMIGETEAAKEKLAALTPPAPCAAHYRESLGSLDDALAMLRSLKTAMESSDPAAQLSAVVTRATALRSRSEALQREDQALRQRYGLTR